jgi:hypothetical protein
MNRTVRSSGIGGARRVKLALALVATVAAGCELPRVNHYHSDTNQKLAEEALDQFDQFTTGTASLATLLDKNLQARQTLETAVSNAHLRVVDTELANLTTDVSWLRLRARLLADLGMLQDEPTDDTKAIAAGNPPIDVSVADEDRLGKLVGRYNVETDYRIRLRQIRVAAVARELRLLAAAQQALADQAAKDADAARKDLTDAQDRLAGDQAKNAPAAAATAAANQAGAAGAADQQRRADRCKRIQWINGLFSRLAAVGLQMRAEDSARQVGTDLQRKLLAAVDESRDPASAVALAAVVGTGLDDDSFALLDDYVARLAGEVDVLHESMKDVPPAPADRTVGGGSGGGMSDAWRELLDALDEAARSLHLAQLATAAEAVGKGIEMERHGAAAASPAPRTVAAAAATPSRAPRPAFQNMAAWQQFSSTVGLSAANENKRVGALVPPALSKPAHATTTVPGLAPAKLAPALSAPMVALYEQYHPEIRGSVFKRQVSEDQRLAADATVPAAQRDAHGKRAAVLTQLDDALTQARQDPSGSLLRAANRLDDTRRGLVVGAKNVRAAASAIPTDASAAAFSASVAAHRQALGNSAATNSPPAVTSDQVGRAFLERAFVALPQFGTALDAALDPNGDCAKSATASTAAPGGTGTGTASGTTTTTTTTAASTSTVAAQAKQSKSAARDKAIRDAADKLGKAVDGILNDVQKEQDAANLRVSEFLSELRSAQLDLDGENVRHAQQMLAVAEHELKRWVLIGDLNADYGEIFIDNTAPEQQELRTELDAARAEQGDAEVRLRVAHKAFTDAATVATPNAKVLNDARIQVNVLTDEVDEARARADGLRRRIEDRSEPLSIRLFHTASGWPVPLPPPRNNPDNTATALVAGPPAPPASDPPVLPVVPEDRVLAALHRLRESAQAAHNAKFPADRDGWHLLASNARLFKGVRTVSGHILMLSLNEHLSEDNVIRLRTELAEHDLHLDALEARIHESAYRLTLTDLKAFHSSGITDADIKTVAGGLLAYIAAKQ